MCSALRRCTLSHLGHSHTRHSHLVHPIFVPRHALCTPQIDPSGDGEVDEGEFVEAIILAVVKAQNGPAPDDLATAGTAEELPADHSQPKFKPPPPLILPKLDVEEPLTADGPADAAPAARACNGSAHVTEAGCASEPPPHPASEPPPSAEAERPPSARATSTKDVCAACARTLPSGLRFCLFCGDKLAQPEVRSVPTRVCQRVPTRSPPTPAARRPPGALSADFARRAHSRASPPARARQARRIRCGAVQAVVSAPPTPPVTVAGGGGPPPLSQRRNANAGRRWPGCCSPVC